MHIKLTEFAIMMTMLPKLSLIVKKEFEKLCYIYRMPIHNSCIILENDFLILKELHVSELYYSKHGIVPRDLCSIVSIVFHASPVGVILMHLTPLLVFVLNSSGPKCIIIYTICAKNAQAVDTQG